MDLGDLVLIAFLSLVAIIIYMLLPMIWGAAYAPSPRREIRAVLKSVLNECCSEKELVKIIDLGSGFGRVCFEAVKIDRRVVCHGIDIDPIKILWSRPMARLKGVSGRVRFMRGNAAKIDLNGYDIIYMFLWPGIVEKIERKILEEVRNSCTVISLEHPLRLIASEKIDGFYVGRVNRVSVQ